MNSLALTIKTRINRPKKILIEIDAEKLERLAAILGLFNPDFLKSLKKAEMDYRAGRTRKIASLKQLK